MTYITGTRYLLNNFFFLHRCEEWRNAINRPDLFHSTCQHFNKRYKVCSKPFKAKMYMHHTSSRLINTAVPTISHHGR